MMRRIAAIGFVVATAACLIVQAQTAPEKAAAAKTIALQCGNLFDGRGDSLRKNVVIVVEDGRIKDIAATLPTGVEVIDLSRSTCLPGLMDTHTHILLQGDITASGL